MTRTYTSQRLEYRPYDPADLDTVWGWMKDPEVAVNQTISFIGPVKRSQVEAWSAKADSRPLYLCMWTLPTPSTPSVLVGKISLDWAEYGMLHRAMKLRIQIGPEHQGKGYGGEAIRWTLGKAFGSFGAHQVCLDVYEWNVKAKALYEKIGFQTDGRQREIVFFEGRFQDVYHMSMMDREYEVLKQNWTL